MSDTDAGAEQGDGRATEVAAAAAPTLGLGNPDVVRAIEAIVMVSTEPVDPVALSPLLDVPAETVDDLCARLARAYDEAGAGFQLVKVAGGWRYQSHPDLAVYVERYVLEGQTARLSAAALETLAIVAYKQPISRAQVASIRGVDPDGVLRTLQGRGYVDQIGRDPGPGQAMLWGTTPLFLEKLGLNSLADLPALAEFVPGADVVEALEQGLRIVSTSDVAPPAAAATHEPGPAARPPDDRGESVANDDEPAVEPITDADTIARAVAETADHPEAPVTPEIAPAPDAADPGRAPIEPTDG